MTSRDVCQQRDQVLPELLFDPEHASTAVYQHIALCTECQLEFEALQKTVAALSGWNVPDVSIEWPLKMQRRLLNEKRGGRTIWINLLHRFVSALSSIRRMDALVVGYIFGILTLLASTVGILYWYL